MHVERGLVLSFYRHFKVQIQVTDLSSQIVISKVAVQEYTSCRNMSFMQTPCWGQTLSRASTRARTCPSTTAGWF